MSILLINGQNQTGNEVEAPLGLCREHSQEPWVRREPEDNLSSLTDVWAGVQGEVEVTLLLGTGRPGKGGVSAEADIGTWEL